VTIKLLYEKIYFVYSRFGGGATMGCYQPHLACHKMNIPSAVRSERELVEQVNKINNSAIFFLKGRPGQNLIDKLRENHNTVVIYPGDGVLSLITRYFNRTKNVNGVIVGSKDFKVHLDNMKKNSNFQTQVIPANHDIFLDSDKFKKQRESKFKLYFGGSRSHGATQGELGLKDEHNYSEGYFHSLKFMPENMTRKNYKEKEDYVIKVASQLNCDVLNKLIESDENPCKYSCHYAVRAPWIKNYNTQWITKTGGKVSTAAASGANIITSLDPSVRVLIGEEYPYAIDTETSDFKDNFQEICDEMIKKAKDTYNTKIWHDGLKILQDVKEKTTTKRITTEYINFFNRLKDEK